MPDEVLQLLLAGDVADALAAAQRRVAEAPQDSNARYGLASALAAGGDAEGASVALNQARLLQSIVLMSGMGADVEAMSRLPAQAVAIGNQLYAARHVAMASVAYGMAVSAGERGGQALLSYGLSLQHQGRAEEAIPVFRAITELYPGAAGDQFLLVPHFYVADGIARHAAEAKAWAARHAPPVPAPPFANPPSAGRRLKIGYVAPSFVGVQVRQFIQPILDAHDRDAFDVFVYPARPETTAGDQPVHVTPIGEIDDRAAADLIRGEGIDVLIDAWGHNAGSRLGVFALRAAPVQATWLNYQQTTGMTAMDYALCADSVDAPRMDEAFVEKVWRVGPTSAPFRPDGPPPITPAPALKNGYPTFASFNNPAKLSDETVAAWARILKGRPEARLILKYGYFEDPVLRSVTAARFAAHGVDPARIDFRGQSKGEAYVAEFGDVDLALDPSPVPGGTTSLEALSRGVPVLTVVGPTFYSRAALQILTGAGLDELVADDWDDYVARAIRLSATPEGLQGLRERTRAGFAAANYRDEAAVTRDLEAAFRGMFEAWEAR
jgi:predicted O-linked N-acetylglucosamine transferase (SPINDLY family)